MVIAVHINPTQAHQREHGEWLRRGFERHGLKVEVTSDPNLEADIHVVSGPHYCKARWQGHKRTILLDRAYWHEQMEPGIKSMPWVSLGWMRDDGGRNFRVGEGRAGTNRRSAAASKGCIFLADYGGPIEQADTVRYHPADRSPEESLGDALLRHDVAIGYQTTALVTAGLMGLQIICKDPRNIMWEPNWLDLLPYADWHWKEIESGEAWEHLKHDLDPL